MLGDEGEVRFGADEVSDVLPAARHVDNSMAVTAVYSMLVSGCVCRSSSSSDVSYMLLCVFVSSMLTLVMFLWDLFLFPARVILH